MTDLSSYSDEELNRIAGGGAQAPPDLSSYSDDELEALAAPTSVAPIPRPPQTLTPPSIPTPRPDSELAAPGRPPEPTIGPTKPSALEELAAPLLGKPGERTILGRAIYGEEATPQAPDYGRGYNLPLVKPEEFLPEGKNLPAAVGIPTEAARGLLHAAGEVTTPQNASILGGMGIGALGGLGVKAGKNILGRLVSAGFSYQMGKAAYEQFPNFRQAVDSGDYLTAARLAGEMLTSGAFAGLSAYHAGAPETHVPAAEPPERTVAQAVVQGKLSAKDAIPTAQFLKSVQELPEAPLPETLPPPEEPAPRKPIEVKPPEPAEPPAVESPREEPPITKPSEESVTKTPEIVTSTEQPVPPETTPVVEPQEDQLVSTFDDGTQRFKRADGSYYEVPGKPLAPPEESAIVPPTTEPPSETITAPPSVKPPRDRGRKSAQGPRNLPEVEAPREIPEAQPAVEEAKPVELPTKVEPPSEEPASRFGSEKGAVVLPEALVGKAQDDIWSDNYKKSVALREAKGPIVTRLGSKLRELPTNLRRKYEDQFIDVKNWVKAAGQMEKDASENPYKDIRSTYGGAAGLTQADFIRYARAAKESEKSGLLSAVTGYMDLKGWDRGIRTLEDKIEHRQRFIDETGAKLEELRRKIRGIETTRGTFGTKQATELESFKRHRDDLVEAGNEAREKLRRYRHALQAAEVAPGAYTKERIAEELKAGEKKAGPEKWAQIQELAGKVFDLNRKKWDQAYASGMIPENVWKKGIERGNEYVPLFRLLDEVQENTAIKGKGLNPSQRKILNPFEGSGVTTQNPWESSMAQAQASSKEIAKNDTVSGFASWIDRMRKEKVPGIEGGLLRPGEDPKRGFGVIEFYRDGKKIRYEVPQLIANAVGLLETPKQTSWVGETALRVFKNIGRAAFTSMNPSFGSVNPIKDIQDVALFSKAIRGPKDLAQIPTRWAAALKSVITQDEGYLDWLEARGGYATLQKSVDAPAFLRESLGPRTVGQRLNLPVRAMDVTSKAVNAPEEATKVMVYKMLRDRGWSREAAAWESRNSGSPDFANVGGAAAQVNNFIQFFSAMVAGTSRDLTAIKSNPKRMAKLMIAATAGELALYSWNRQFTNPDDGKPEVDHITDDQEQNYWNILMPWTTRTSGGATRYAVRKIAKGHGAQTMFNPIGDAVRAIFGGRGSVEQSALDVVSNVLPGRYNIKKGHVARDVFYGTLGSINPLPKTTGEEIGNIDTHTKMPIVSKSLEGKEGPFQYSDRTSELAKRVSRTFPNVPVVNSPARVEHILRSTLGGPAEAAMSVGDWALRKSRKGLPLEGDEKWARMPLVGQINRRFVGGGGDQVERDKLDEFYQGKEQAEKAATSFSGLSKKDSDEAERYLNEPGRENLIVAAPMYRKASQSITEIRDQMRAIQESDELGPEEKRAALRELRQAQSELVDEVNGSMRELTVRSPR